MYTGAKSTRCWKHSPHDPQIHFPLGSMLQQNWPAVSTGLSFINTLFNRSEKSYPIRMENNKNHQITFPKKKNRIFSLDVMDQVEKMYQIRRPYELTTAIMATDE